MAICDVLGFKELLRDADLSGLHERYRQLLRAVNRSAVVTAASERDPWQFTTTSYIGHTVFSDSIILWSPPVPRKKVNYRTGQWKYRDDWGSGLGRAFGQDLRFFLSVSSLIGIGLVRGFPLRIGIAFGDCVIEPDKSIFLGQPLVDAFETERRQQWIGAVCHPSCIVPFVTDHLLKPQNPPPGRFASIPFLVRYDIPVQQLQNASTILPPLLWSVDWPRFSDSEVEKVLIAATARYKHNPNISVKWENALKFYQERRRALSEMAATLVEQAHKQPVTGVAKEILVENLLKLL